MFRGSRRVGPPRTLRQTLEQTLSFFRVALKIPEDVLDQDHRRIHDDAEIHRAHGQQVGAFALNHQENGGEEQRERDVQSNDDRAAEIAEENPLDQEDQQASENQVVQNGVRGDGDQRGAVVKRNDPDSRRQAPVVIQLVDGRFDLGNHVGGLFRSPHHHDRPNDIVLLVAAQNAEPWPVADRHLADILHQHRDAVGLGQNHILDVVNLVALRQIVIAAIVNQTDAADIDGLLADADFASADVDVGVAQRGQDLGHGDAVGFQLVRVHLDLEFLGGAAPTVDGGDAGNGQQPARHDPILNGAQIGDSEMLAGRPPDNDRFPQSSCSLGWWAPDRRAG